MPVVTIQTWEETLDASTAERLIGSVTDAVVGVFGEQARPTTTVLLSGVAQARWGSGGVPASRRLAAEDA